MGFAQDAKAQWDKLPKGGKIAIGGGILVLLFIMVYKHQSGGGTSTSASGMTSGNLPATNETSSQSPAGAFPGVQSGGSTVPYLPSGINPVYDAQGGLVAFQQAGAGNPSASGSVSPPPSPTQPASSGALSTIAGYLGLTGPNTKVTIAKDGLASDSTYINAQGQTVPLSTLIPGTDKITQGSENRVWYSDAGGQHLLTSGTGGAVDPTTNKKVSASPTVTNQQNTQTTTNTNSGGGGESYQSYARGLREYTVSYGDNLHTIANQLRIKGGLPAWLAHNGNPTDFFHGMTLKVPS